MLVRDGLRLFKFYLTVGREMQLKHFHSRFNSMPNTTVVPTPPLVDQHEMSTRASRCAREQTQGEGEQAAWKTRIVNPIKEALIISFIFFRKIIYIIKKIEPVKTRVRNPSQLRRLLYLFSSL